MMPNQRLLLNPPGIVKAGLVAHYDFVQGGDSQVLYDKSGHGYNGQLGSASGSDTNDPAWGVKGLTFGSDDCVTLGTPAAMCIAGEQSVTWAGYIPAAAGCLVSRADTYNSNGAFVIRREADGKLWTYWGGTIYPTAPSVPAGNYIITCTFKPSTHMEIYINGEQVSRKTTGVASALASTAPVLLGKQNNNTMYASGYIAGYFAFHNISLSAAQAKKMHKYIKPILAKRGVTI